MTSREIRQSFLDFFKSKQHTLVPSSSLMPDAPNLLFTNAGMNQFVPIFLGQKAADVSRWAGAVPGRDTRAADTQKCIRAGGKHNDLEDVGLDTYHHTFFEMLGNWSFGDYFKKEAIEWAWELVVGIWKFPAARLYATVYSPDRTKGDPAEFDQEAYDHWARLFTAAGLDPKVHICAGGKKDNFWMMGDTGPCGPCSELHVDLTPNGDTKGALVNQGSAQCIEIWNLVFMQFNAGPDASFAPLPAKSVDTGMGFERVTGIIQNTKGFTDFSRVISNYETDIFRPIFDKLAELSGRQYASTLPKPGSSGETEQERIDVAFRVIADHIRTLSFAIADGIQPGNNDRNYVLRRILRRAVRYGRALGFHQPFFYKLVAVLAETMGDVFPEIRAKRRHVEEVIRMEEEAFNKTLDTGIKRFNEICANILATSILDPNSVRCTGQPTVAALDSRMKHDPEDYEGAVRDAKLARADWDPSKLRWISGEEAFKLYDTYGFPLDLTELMARERKMLVDSEGFSLLMEEQRARARAAQKKEVVEVDSDFGETVFVGYECFETNCTLLTWLLKTRSDSRADFFVITDRSPLYAEMGGQVGDTGMLMIEGLKDNLPIVDTVKRGSVFYHRVDPTAVGVPPWTPASGAPARLVVDRDRRNAIQRHHTGTHLLHWALHEVVSRDASQKGSFVGPDKLTFDFNAAPLTPQQLADVEKLVNERILENAGVSWTEVRYNHVKDRKDVMQFFGDKYGEWVRVVQIGGQPTSLDGFSMELCGGTHTRATGEIGLFRITHETAIAAGVRRIEAIAGLEAWRRAGDELAMLKNVAGRLATPIPDLDKKVENLLAHQRELEKQLKAMQQKEAAGAAKSLLAKAQTINGIPALIERFDADGDTLQGMVNELKGLFRGVILLGGAANGAVALIASVAPDFTAKIQAGKLIQQIAPIVGGKGGGKPDNARGGGKDITKLDQALTRARALLG